MKLIKNKSIKLSIKYNGQGSYSNYYINTYSSYFPGYDIEANSPYDGEYYLTTYNEDHNYIFKLLYGNGLVQIMKNFII